MLGPCILKVWNWKKVWIALFTCYIMCTIHLELIPDITTETFI